MQNTKGKLPVYRITVKGLLNERWVDRFPGLQIVHEGSEVRPSTSLIGPLDQAALHGVLSIIRDLNLRLISVVEYDE